MICEFCDHTVNPASTRLEPNVDLKLAHRLRRRPSIDSSLGQRPLFVGLSEKLETLSNGGSVLYHRLRRWYNTDPTLGQRLVFAGNEEDTTQHAFQVANIPFYLETYLQA